MSSDAFDENALLAEARQATGLSDFGAEDFRDGLRALIQMAEKNPFTEKGRAQHRGRLVMLLSTRLKIQEALRRHPEILEREIVRPMFLTGLPRSGTSALFNLLAADPDARPLYLWEGIFPDPNWDLAPGEIDPRYKAMKAVAEQNRAKNPEFTKAHFADADTPEECVLLHAFGLDGGQLGYELMLEPYASWFAEHDFGPLYRYYADLLRLLDWQRPGKRWLLKTPSHLWALDALVETFPDCSIVWNHRDPAVCIPSISSMIYMIVSDRVEIGAEAFGPLVLKHYADSMDVALEARGRLDAARFVDVDYDELVSDNLAAVAKIYEQFDLPLEGPAREAMDAYSASHPQGKHGKHEYDLASFGLTREAVRERFADYVERFGL
ncbi:MAG: sulfotransferase [Myxococcales bacterium]|nr:sulfotransferase [Myxococcales bacterium]